MSNISPLADRYADLKAQITALEDQLDAVKLEIRATGVEEIVGQRAVVTIGLSERSTLDQKAVKAILTAKQLAECTKTNLIETIRVKNKLEKAA